MDIRNRMNDVVALRCHVCQDFLKLVLIPDWKTELYKKVQYNIKNNIHKENYIGAYNNMRDMGLDAYDVDCMDVSFISVILQFCADIIAPIHKKTKEAFIRLKDDRNTINGHSSENESTEKLYQNALISIVDIIKFIEVVDENEDNIQYDDRLTFRKKWKSKAEELKSLLDDERIEFVQIQKEIARDIEVIKNAEDTLRAWEDIYCKYKNIWITEKYDRFIVAASDAGIEYAHEYAVLIFQHKQINYDEFFRRLYLFYTEHKPLLISHAHFVLNSLNGYLDQGNEENEHFNSAISYLKKSGFDVYCNHDRYYINR